MLTLTPTRQFRITNRANILTEHPVGGCQSTQREQACGKHANSTQKGPSWDSNQGPLLPWSDSANHHTTVQPITIYK